MPSLYKALPGLKRGDIVLTHNDLEAKRFAVLVHRVDIDESRGSAELYGKLLDGKIDFDSPDLDGTSLSHSFRTEPNPDVALAMIKQKITDPLLKSHDAAIEAYTRAPPDSMVDPASNGPFQIDLEHAKTENIGLSSGSIRKHLLGGCPFKCVQGHVYGSTILQRWPNLLDGMPEGSRERLLSIGRPPCPGCLGVDCCRTQIKLLLEIDAMDSPMSYDALLLWARLREVDKDRKLDCGYSDSNSQKNGMWIYGPLGLLYASYLRSSPHSPSDEVPELVDAEPPAMDSHQTLRVRALPLSSTDAEGDDEDSDEDSEDDSEEDVDDPSKEARLALIDGLTSAPYELWMAAKERVGNDNCPVCKLDGYEEGQTVVALPCKHFLNKSCLTPWLEKNDSCPVCRAKLPGFEELADDDGESNWEADFQEEESEEEDE